MTWWPCVDLQLLLLEAFVVTGAIKATLSKYKQKPLSEDRNTDTGGCQWCWSPWQCDSSPRLSPVWPGSQAWIQKNEDKKQEETKVNKTIKKYTEYQHERFVGSKGAFKTQPQTLTTAQSWIKERWRFRHAFSDSWAQESTNKGVHLKRWFTVEPELHWDQLKLHSWPRKVQNVTSSRREMWNKNYLTISKYKVLKISQVIPNDFLNNVLNNFKSCPISSSNLQVPLYACYLLTWRSSSKVRIKTCPSSTSQYLNHLPKTINWGLQSLHPMKI